VVLLSLFLATLASAPVVAADIGSPGADMGPVAGVDEDETEDYKDGDGSEALVGGALIVPANLQPIELADEEALLGVWGDAPSEDED
jgi:hypothetical protein